MKMLSTELNYEISTADGNILSRIDLAMENDEFVVVYQPKFDLLSLHTVGAEALVRWQLPDGQMIPPSQFIPVFEESGHIRQLDFLVLEKTCRMLRRAIRGGIAPVPVSVNFSRLHIHTPDFVERLHETVRSFGIPAGLIEIEFTESAFIDDVPPLDQLIEQLHALGYRVAMDDFGTGFSSLNELMNLQVDILKLDRAFLRLTSRNEARARCIIHAIMHMARTLEIKVVAEGVEDMRAITLLRQCGCSIGQGYFYSKPVSEEYYLASLLEQPAAI